MEIPRSVSPTILGFLTVLEMAIEEHVLSPAQAQLLLSQATEEEDGELSLPQSMNPLMEILDLWTADETEMTMQ